MKGSLPFVVLLLFSSFECLAQLFGEQAPLQLELVADWQALRVEAQSAEPQPLPAKLVLAGTEGAMDVQVQPRGNSRRQQFICDFPPLWIYFSPEASEGTPFEGQERLKLVTHCRYWENFQQYILKEYLAYRMYQLFTQNSLQVRLARIRYVDGSGRKKPFERWGFFIEDVDALAARRKGRELDVEEFARYPSVGRQILVTAMFQYMIGNSDWGLPNLHNVKAILREGAREPVVVPYDFDWSGFVHAPYATPHPSLGIASVRERVYQGFCHSEEEFAFAVAFFLAKKEEVLTLVHDNDLLSKAVRKDALKYLEGFFDFLSDEEAAIWEFRRGCGR